MNSDVRCKNFKACSSLLTPMSYIGTSQDKAGSNNDIAANVEQSDPLVETSRPTNTPTKTMGPASTSTCTSSHVISQAALNMTF